MKKAVSGEAAVDRCSAVMVLVAGGGDYLYMEVVSRLEGARGQGQLGKGVRRKEKRCATASSRRRGLVPNEEGNDGKKRVIQVSTYETTSTISRKGAWLAPELMGDDGKARSRAGPMAGTNGLMGFALHSPTHSRQARKGIRFRSDPSCTA